MAEIIYDAAPGVSADVLLDRHPRRRVGKASSIADLVAQGVRIIADDIFYLDEPMFQDGVDLPGRRRRQGRGRDLPGLRREPRQAELRGAPWHCHGTGRHDFDPGAGCRHRPDPRHLHQQPGAVHRRSSGPSRGAPRRPTSPSTGYIDNVLVATGRHQQHHDRHTRRVCSGSAGQRHSTRWAIGIRRVGGDGTSVHEVHRRRHRQRLTVSRVRRPTRNAINPTRPRRRGRSTIAATQLGDAARPPSPSARAGPAVTRLFNTTGAPGGARRPAQARPRRRRRVSHQRVPSFPPFGGTSAATPSAAGIAAWSGRRTPTLTVDQVAAILTNPADALDCPATARPARPRLRVRVPCSPTGRSQAVAGHLTAGRRRRDESGSPNGKDGGSPGPA